MLRGFATASVLALVSGFSASAQQADPSAVPNENTAPGLVFQSPVLTIKQQELFENSAFGKTSLARLELALGAIAAENRKIEAGLEAEEKDLTKLRLTMAPAEFRLLADEFDKKVEEIRAAQDTKSRNLNRQREADRQKFYEYAVPVLAELMRELGAVALMDQSAIVLSLDRIDITEQAIARLDALTLETEGTVDGTPRSSP
jgi:Skp family chaperone for outer membrane proteins